MTSIDEIVRELTFLGTKATPVGWRSQDNGVFFQADGWRTLVATCSTEGPNWRNDAAFIAAARNHLPALLSALARSRRMEEALQACQSMLLGGSLTGSQAAIERTNALAELSIARTVERTDAGQDGPFRVCAKRNSPTSTPPKE